MIEPIAGAFVGFVAGFLLGRFKRRRKVTVILDKRRAGVE